MKKTQLALAFAMMASGSVYAADFINGGFENGNLTGWSQGGGSWNNTPPVAPLSPASFAGGTSNNTIVGAGTDPITGASTVYNGNSAVRVNDSINDTSVSTISQSVLGYGSNSIYFVWNAVLEASHDLTDSDHFALTLHDDTTGLDVLSRSYSSAGSIGSGTTGVTWTPAVNDNSWFTSGWVQEQIDLAALGIVGHDFTLSLLAADCPYSGHAGYVYLDGFGGAAVDPGPGTGGTVPEPTSIALLGLGALGLIAARRRKTA